MKHIACAVFLIGAALASVAGVLLGLGALFGLAALVVFFIEQGQQFAGQVPGAILGLLGMVALGAALMGLACIWPERT